jgi:hypothetical protein
MDGEFQKGKQSELSPEINSIIMLFNKKKLKKHIC